MPTSRSVISSSHDLRPTVESVTYPRRECRCLMTRDTFSAIAAPPGTSPSASRLRLAIRESEQRFRTLFEKANDAIFLENEHDEIVEVNERACALLGYSRQELLTMKVSDLQAPEIRGPVGGVIRGELERHGDATFETIDLHRSGRRILVEVTNTPIFDQGQKLVLSVVRDVTERKRAAEALQQMHEQLAHANRVATMGQLTASIAHEIAQPIGAVYNRANAAINFLNKDPPDLEEVREAITRYRWCC